MKFKYIVVMQNGMEMPILFSVLQNHKDLGSKFPPSDIVSAGFVSISESDKFNEHGFKDLDFTCFGESVGLKIRSRPQDSELVKYNYNFKI